MAAKHSARYETVKGYYERGLWSVARLQKAVSCGWITSDEYTEICGEDYK